MHYQATKITRFFGLFGGANKEVKKEFFDHFAFFQATVEAIKCLVFVHKFFNKNSRILEKPSKRP